METISLDEAAQKLGVSRRRVNQYISDPNYPLPAEWNAFARRWEVQLLAVETYKRPDGRAGRPKSAANNGELE